jgi:hypothetical protein
VKRKYIWNAALTIIVLLFVWLSFWDEISRPGLHSTVNVLVYTVIGTVAHFTSLAGILAIVILGFTWRWSRSD